MQNFNSLGCLVLEISAFQYEACNGLRAGASVHKLFVGGVLALAHRGPNMMVAVFAVGIFKCIFLTGNKS